MTREHAQITPPDAFRRRIHIFGLATLTCVAAAGCQSAPPAETSEEVGSNQVQPAETATAAPDAAVAQEPAAPVTTPPPLPEAAATFDAAWTLVYESHFDPEFNGVDWVAVRDELRPQALEATSTSELRSVLGQMIGRLNQSHFAVLPAEVVDAMDPDQWDEADVSADDGPSATPPVDDESAPAATNEPDDANEPAPAEPDANEIEIDSKSASGSDRSASPGLDVRLLGGEVLVTSVRQGFPAAEAGVKPGWVVEAVGSRDTGSLIERLKVGTELNDRIVAYEVAQAVHELLRGSPGSTTSELRFRDGNDEIVTLTLERMREPGVPVRFGNLPTMVAELNDRRIDSGGAQIGYIAFNIWMVPIARPFHVAIDKYREADGIIVDLRGNVGGVGAMSMGIAGHFFDTQQRLGTMSTRESDLNFVANPRFTTSDHQPTQPYAGPVAILVDEGTASTSEIFAGGLQSVARARIFGRTTMGAALPAKMTRLPNGDVLLHAFADYVDANGEHLEGEGVVPDEPVETTREQLLEGRDPVLDAAVRWIESQAAEASPVTPAA